jgi:hypothetical protein
MDQKTFEQEKKLLAEARKKVRKEKIKRWISFAVSYLVISFLFSLKTFQGGTTLEFILNALLLGATLCAGAIAVNVLSTRLFSAYDEAKLDYHFHRRLVLTEEQKREEDQPQEKEN